MIIDSLVLKFSEFEVSKDEKKVLFDAISDFFEERGINLTHILVAD
jgi:hypothetical protein